MPDNRASDGNAITETTDDEKSFSSNAINALMIDSTGNLWVGTANGLNRFEPGKGFVHYDHDPTFSKSLSKNHVISLFEDHSGTLWIGTYAGGINIYDRQTDLFAYYRPITRWT